MAWPLVCLFLLTVCSGSFSQLVVTQPPSASASLGATAKLSCTLSGGDSSRSIYWYQQRPGKAPRYIMYVGSGGSAGRGEGIPDRFSGSGSGVTRYLSISNIQPEDEADYYCQSSYYDGSVYYVFGGGTQLTVLGQPKAAPTVNIFAPSQDELATPKATIVCLISGFYPGAVEVAWTKDGSPVSQGVETSRPSRQSDNKYSASSYLSLTANQWQAAKTFTCKVTHDGKVIQKEVSSSQCT
ncbi:immunoglobulin lambda-1 light chain-like isoform X2 [Dromiciops gliroides]|uniref:immunoglobulin lambda-1 light chain-like isoform X2 n=1 Tax=Dromiciops gliroides TaxID=33562 RepID=UPI001CC5484D|nr:immunoglobulin lambda-1 light chain-like isoform X2 [Dromiciops gliroides]